MDYILIADMDAQKFNIYHLRGNESFYHAFSDFIEKKTGHCVLASLQNNPLINVSIADAGTKDDGYFEPFLIEFRAKKSNKNK